MRWTRALIVPHVVRLGLRAPRDVSSRWDRYWAGVTATGDGGDVLWDSSGPDEVGRYLARLAEHADPGLAVVDAGCGNGRFTRALADRFPRAVGVDLSPHAVALAAREAPDRRRVDFRTADLTVAGVGRELQAELGDTNVFVRGVLHVLDRGDRRSMATNLLALLGVRGTLLLAETDYPGPLLGYLESLGAGPKGLPHPLARAVAAGIPRPSSFGEAEVAASFPRSAWEYVLAETTRIATVPMGASDTPGSVPGHLAVLRPRRPARGE